MLLFNIAIASIYWLGFSLLIWKFKAVQFKHFKPVISVVFFNLKVLAGVALWLVYTFYYKDIARNDAHKYFNDALTLHEIRAENTNAFCELMFTSKPNNYSERLNHWSRNFDEAPVNENRTIIRLQSVLMFASFKIYFVHILFMCFLSFLGYVLLVNALAFFSVSSTSTLWLAAVSLPSVLFWSSGVMKEPLLILGIGIFVSGLIVDRKILLKVGWIFVGALVIISTKFYVLASLLPASLAFSFFRKRDELSFVLAKYFFAYALTVLMVFNSRYFFEGVDIPQVMVNKQLHSIKEAEYFDAGSRTDIQKIDGSLLSIVSATPDAIRNVLFRPFLWETRKPLMLVNALENFLILLLLVFAIAKTDFRKMTQINLVLFLLVSSLTFFVLVGITTPVLGNLVRYKVPVLTIFLSAFLLNANFRQTEFLNKLIVKQ